MSVLTNKDLTGGEVEGSGLFDELMRTVKAHLEVEFDKGAITGDSYAQVYLGSLQAVLQTASQYVLTMELTNQQILKLQEEVQQAQKQNELLELQKEQLRIANETAQYTLDNLLPQQMIKGTAEITLLNTQNINMEANTALVEKQMQKVDAETSMTGKQEDLVDEQILAAKDMTRNPTGGINKVNYDKIVAENALLAQRKLTEVAQTVGDATTVRGLVGSQISLVEAQKDGFHRDAEQKAAKIFSDAYSVAYTTTPEESGYTPQAYGLDGASAQAVFAKLKLGIKA